MREHVAVNDPLKERDLAGGIALLVTGLVALVPSALCTIVLVGGALINLLLHPDQTTESLDMLGLTLVVGGPFVILGIVLVRIGALRLRHH